MIGIGTRYSDFTTASKTAFRDPDVRFVNVNVADVRRGQARAAFALVGDARATLEQLAELLDGGRSTTTTAPSARELNREWDDEVDAPLRARPRAAAGAERGDRRGQRRVRRRTDVVVCAAGSMPGDLHKLWRTRDPKGYHVEYGYSCMGYEIAGGLGVKMAAPEREVYVLVGDGSYLMMPGEIVTAVQEGVKLVDRARRQPRLQLDRLAVARRSAWTASARSTASRATARPCSTATTTRRRSCRSISPRTRRRWARTRSRVGSIAELRETLAQARAATKTTVIVVEVDRYEGVPGYESWWDVPVAEVSERPAVREARAEYEAAKAAERRYLLAAQLDARLGGRGAPAEAVAQCGAERVSPLAAASSAGLWGSAGSSPARRFQRSMFRRSISSTSNVIALPAARTSSRSSLASPTPQARSVRSAQSRAGPPCRDATSADSERCRRPQPVGRRRSDGDRPRVPLWITVGKHAWFCGGTAQSSDCAAPHDARQGQGSMRASGSSIRKLTAGLWASDAQASRSAASSPPLRLRQNTTAPASPAIATATVRLPGRFFSGSGGGSGSFRFRKPRMLLSA